MENTNFVTIYILKVFVVLSLLYIFNPGAVEPSDGLQVQQLSSDPNLKCLRQC